MVISIENKKEVLNTLYTDVHKKSTEKTYQNDIYFDTLWLHILERFDEVTPYKNHDLTKDMANFLDPICRGKDKYGFIELSSDTKNALLTGYALALLDMKDSIEVSDG